MDSRDTFLYYSRQDVTNAGTNYRALGNNGGGMKDEHSRVSESPVNENEHYYTHTSTKIECNSDSPPNSSSNGEYSIKRHQDSPPDHINGVPPVKKGRGRPKKICDGVEVKEWNDDEIYKLIELWGKHDILYNCKHPLYHNKAEKTKAMETLRERLEEAGVSATTRQIFDKLTTLRNYYGAVKRKTESLKRQGFEGEDTYFCRWQFYQPLSFLEGTFSPRHSDLHYKKLPFIMDNTSLIPTDRPLPSLLSVTNQQLRQPISREIFDRPKETIQQNPNQLSRPIQHNHGNPSGHNHNHLINHSSQPSQVNESSQSHHSISQNSAHPPNHPLHGNQLNHPNQPSHPNQVPHSTRSNHSPHPTNEAREGSPTHQPNHTHHKQTNTTIHNGSEKTEDQLFGEMVAKMIAGIVDSEEKALLLIRIQQDIVQTKFRTKSAFQKPRVHSTTPNWNNSHPLNPPQKETNNSHEYYSEQKSYRSLEHSPLSSRSDSPLSSPACPPKLDMGS